MLNLVPSTVYLVIGTGQPNEGTSLGHFKPSLSKKLHTYFSYGYIFHCLRMNLKMDPFLVILKYNPFNYNTIYSKHCILAKDDEIPNHLGMM